jgi:8-oxo-dGTP pyrophosphatase MutT (NUDIX family)
MTGATPGRARYLPQPMLDLLPATDPRLRSGTDLDVARELVGGASGAGVDQDAIRRQILAFVDAHPDAARRSCHDGHLTGSALVLDASGERMLMLFHRKAQRWLQPGGHADGDTNLAAVALREATEETGIDGLRVAVPAIDLDVHRVHFAGEHAHLHLDVRFLVVAPVGAVESGNHESEALRWVTVDELGSLEGVDAGTIRMAARGFEVMAGE